MGRKIEHRALENSRRRVIHWVSNTIKDHKSSQRVCGEVIGITQQAMNKRIRENGTFTLDEVLTIATYYGVPRDELMKEIMP